jgi:hypothetical protein
MESLEIIETIENIRRYSHRVKNAGNFTLSKKGQAIVRKIRKSNDLLLARKYEAKYIDEIRNEYDKNFPIGISSKNNQVLNMADGYGPGDPQIDYDKIDNHIPHKRKHK